MSVVFAHEGEPTVAAEELKAIASDHSISLSESDAADYLFLLNSLDATIQQIADLPPYVDPRLLPEESTLPRTWSKPTENPQNAWSHLTNITSSRPLDTRLAGKTVALKDNISIAQVPLTGGTFPEIFHDKPQVYVPQIDAIVVKRLLQSGATVAGSATCENFSMSPLSFTSATGPVHNVWLRGYTTGGSSSGSATLVSINVINAWRKRHNLPSIEHELGPGVDMAVGGDQGGSIRIPAAYCGIYGLKPTHGLVPYTGILGLHPMIDHTGPLAASLEDIATMLSVMAGYDGIDPRMTPESPLRANVKDYKALLDSWVKSKEEAGEWTPTASGKGLRIGLIKESLEVMGLSPTVKSAVIEAVARFKAIGAEVKELSIPLHLIGPSIWTIATRMGLSYYGFQNNPQPMLNYPIPDLSPPTFGQKAFDLLTKHNPAVVNIFFSHQLRAKDPARLRSVTAKAMMHVHELRAAYDAALADVDVLVTPVNPRVGSKHPDLASSVKEKMEPGIGGTLNTCGFNVTGHPGLSIPIGFGEVDGANGGKMPIGMQIVGKRWDEETVLKAAKAWEVPGLGLDTWDGR
ncbi:uncharacterized protein PV09_06442 [Verruconis gallopava]|uniref:Amidase domain-containing protein n=1 Tax=Verruconis gallopava TaxID=253628 RepID=A0A0D2A6T3_9PEZI|nr:uncharacterized protein PV09_06442 [Verruconis gallopava]KIW02295.1 hypothetical protein PV09_06442 [Verruconis gallopava]